MELFFGAPAPAEAPATAAPAAAAPTPAPTPLVTVTDVVPRMPTRLSKSSSTPTGLKADGPLAPLERTSLKRTSTTKFKPLERGKTKKNSGLIDRALVEMVGSLRSAADAGSLTVIPWGRLHLREAIAKGGFGQVTKGKYNDADIAVKQLLPGVGEAKDLLEEMETMCKLVHPNLLATIGLATDYGQNLGVVMEFLPASLNSLLHSKAYRKAYANLAGGLGLRFDTCYLALITDVAVGMQHLHSLNMIHRDLKPDNVLVSPDWKGKIADFGTVLRRAVERQKAEAKLAEEEEVAAMSGGCACFGGGGGSKKKPAAAVPTAAVPTGGGSDEAEGGSDHVVGTASYLSPEVASNGTDQVVPTVPASDVWSFGCVLAHVAAKMPPYVDVMKKPEEAVYALRDKTARPLTMITDENLPSDTLKAMAIQCTQWEPAERPSFDDICATLQSNETVKEVCGPMAVKVTTDGGTVSLVARRPKEALQWLKG